MQGAFLALTLDSGRLGCSCSAPKSPATLQHLQQTLGICLGITSAHRKKAAGALGCSWVSCQVGSGPTWWQSPPTLHRKTCFLPATEYTVPAPPPPTPPSPWDLEGFGSVWPPLGHGGDAGVLNARKPALTPMPH